MSLPWIKQDKFRKLRFMLTFSYQIGALFCDDTKS